MTPVVLAVALTVALSGVAIALNHVHARLALVELALNEGLPPGHQQLPTTNRVTAHDVGALLGGGVHVFVSRNCHACQRLIDELHQTPLAVAGEVHLRYVDRPRPIAKDAADQLGASLHSHQGELASQAGADPLPFTVAVGSHGLVAGSVSPTVDALVTAARDAGITISVHA